MISTTVGTRQFNLRAAAVILDGSRILLHQMEGDRFWSLPGGRVEGGETASSAVVREMEEELAEPVVCGELLMVVENFFTYRGAQHHELGLYFCAALDSTSRLLTSPGPFFGVESHTRLTFAWFERSELSNIDLRPACLAEALAEPEVRLRHIVHQSENERSG